jgi:hypothetical protein
MLESRLLNWEDRVGAGCPKRQCHKSKEESNETAEEMIVGEWFIR